jgi:hypothetical protein
MTTLFKSKIKSSWGFFSGHVHLVAQCGKSMVQFMVAFYKRATSMQFPNLTIAINEIVPSLFLKGSYKFVNGDNSKHVNGMR